MHPADPMTVDDALFQMELVGHDFYLFHDKESGRPSVVYRRHAYDYGIISLDANARPPPLLPSPPPPALPPAVIKRFASVLKIELTQPS